MCIRDSPRAGVFIPRSGGRVVVREAVDPSREDHGEEREIHLGERGARRRGFDPGALGVPLEVVRAVAQGEVRGVEFEPDGGTRARRRPGATVVAGPPGDGSVPSRLELGVDRPRDLRRAAEVGAIDAELCLLYTSPSPRDATLSRMPSSA